MSHGLQSGVSDLIACSERIPSSRKKTLSLAPLYSLYRIIKTKSEALGNIKPVHHMEITNHRQIANVESLSGRYAPKEVARAVKEKTTDEFIYEHVSGRHEIRVHFFVEDSDAYRQDRASLNRMATKAIIMAEVLMNYKTRRCGRVLTFYIYLTDLEKRLPKDEGAPLGPSHSNTGFAGSCSDGGSIVVYRKEEWFKVLVHELIHYLGLDFSGGMSGTIPARLKSMFPVSSEFNLFEAYTEVWAELLNIVMTYYAEHPDASKEDCLSGLNKLVRIECAFSTFQMVKILAHMGLRYKNLFGTDEASGVLRDHYYREDTNIFCYYVLPSLLLFYHDEFLAWCKDNNLNLVHFSTQRRAQEDFAGLIARLYKSRKFASFVECAERLYEDISKNHPGSPFLWTTRMTIVEN